MPSHQERREPLPEGYQFGDARSSFDSPAQKAIASALLDTIDRAFETSRHRIGETVRVTFKHTDGTTYRGWL